MRGVDWRIRPLSAEMMLYAQLDVHFLPILYLLQTRSLLQQACDESKFYNQLHLQQQQQQQTKEFGNQPFKANKVKMKAKVAVKSEKKKNKPSKNRNGNEIDSNNLNN